MVSSRDFEPRTYLTSPVKIAGDVWHFDIKGKRAEERLRLCNFMDYDTSDPTGNNVMLNNHDQLKYNYQELLYLHRKVDDLEREIQETQDLINSSTSSIMDLINESTTSIESFVKKFWEEVTTDE